MGTINCETVVNAPWEAHLRPHPTLVRGIKCVGAPLALVVAESLTEALDASELIMVDYEILPSVTRVQEAGKRAPRCLGGIDDNLAWTFAWGIRTVLRMLH